MVGRVVLAVFRAMRLIEVREGIGEDGDYTECSNMTIINLALRVIGPTHERRLTVYLLSFQVNLCLQCFNSCLTSSKCILIILLQSCLDENSYTGLM